MAEYKPSFVFQSKINDKLNSTTVPTAQADGDNIIGSVNPSDVSSVIGPKDNLTFQHTAGNLAGSQSTASTVYTDPTYIQGVIDVAARFLCDEPTTPSGCDDPKELVTSSTSNSVICSCASDESFSPPTDDNINEIMKSMGPILQKRKEDAYKNININTSIFTSPPGAPWADYGEIYNSMVEKIIKDTNVTPRQRTEALKALAFTLYDVIINDSWDLDPSYTQWKNSVDNELDRIDQETTDLENDCSLNTVPSANSIIAVINFTNTKAKECTGDLVLNEECECVCPSGTEPCGADTCIGCDSGLIVQKTTDFLNDTVNCECVCPSGTVQYNLPTNMGDRPDGVSKTSCIPECPKGYIFKEIEASVSGDNCDFMIGDRCYACVCPKRGLDGTTLVEEGSCGGDATPDPENQCECKCKDENKTYIDAEDAVRFDLGAPGCYCGTELQLPDSRLLKAFCNNISIGYDLDGNVDYSRLDIIQTPKEFDRDTCSCICPSGMASVGKTCDCLNTLHIWSNYFDGCVCGAQAQQDAGWDPAEYCGTEQSGKIWNGETCECVCPSGTNYDATIEECVCPEGSTPTTPGKPTGGQDCACPEGQIINQNEEGNYYCASGSYTYTNLTMSELSRIASSFGYSFNNTMELL